MLASTRRSQLCLPPGRGVRG